MASKTSKRANAAHKGKSNAPIPKDDGTRWVVLREDGQVYPGPGVMKSQAEHLAFGLADPGVIVQVA